MYQCNDCHLTFDEPVTEAELVDASVGYYEPRFYCPDPDCKSEDIEQLIDCPMCHQHQIESSQDHCETCASITAAWLEEAILSITDETGADRKDILKAMEMWLEKQ